MFKRLRIAVLLYILLFVATGQYLSARRSTDWNGTLRVDIYLVNGAGSAAVQSHIDSLDADAFAGVADFFAREARVHGLPLERPFRVALAGRLDEPPPRVPERSGILGAALFSLRMRWYATKVEWGNDRWAPDITLFAVFHEAGAGAALDRSTALRKGLIAAANLFASPRAEGSNEMIVAHEILHTLGATDKYDPVTTLPVFPQGFADRERSPRYPQSRAELMAGRIPVDAGRAEVPASLRDVVIGPETAAEIGWPAAAGSAQVGREGAHDAERHDLERALMR